MIWGRIVIRPQQQTGTDRQRPPSSAEWCGPRRCPRPDVQPWTETCGQIRCLIEEKDGATGEVHHVEIHDAKLHYYERTDEFYYVIAGQGTMILDDEEIELHAGVVVYVPRGVRHKAKGNLTVLTVCVPRGVLGDVHEVE